MAKNKEKQLALSLRKKGMSYSQIRERVQISKSTLSIWLANMPLSKARLMNLRDWNEKRIENYRQSRMRKREAELLVIREEEKKNIFPLSKRDMFIAGLFLYWGEGSKSYFGTVCVSNTNPAVIKFFIKWLIEIMGVKRADIKVRLHLYADMNKSRETEYWIKVTGLPGSNFKSPYIKNSKLANLTYKRGFGHGTCNVIVNNTILGKRILMGLRAIEESLG